MKGDKTMKVNEIKSISISCDGDDYKTLNSIIELLDKLIATMSNYNCDTLIGENYDEDEEISITTLDLQQTLKIIENISLIQEMI